MIWNPIERTKPVVDGVDPEHQGLLRVHIPLTSTPDAQWGEFFANPTGVSLSTVMHPPELRGASVRITPPDDQLSEYVAHVDERIAAANLAYEQRVVPRLERARAVGDARAADEKSRLEEARRQAEDL